MNGNFVRLFIDAAEMVGFPRMYIHVTSGLSILMQFEI